MKRILLSLIPVVALSTLPAEAGKLAGVTMQDQITAGNEALVLNGMALRKKLVFKVYVAGLYLPAKQSDGAAVLSADTSRKVVMEFLRSVGKDSICGAWFEGLEANVPNAPADLRQDFDTLCGFMEEVGDDDRYEFTYVPGTGTTVTVKGKTKGTIEGKDFADALFSSWIGESPGPGAEFKADLLGN